MINSVNYAEEYCKSKPKCDECKTCARNIKHYHPNFHNDDRIRFINWKSMPDHSEIENKTKPHSIKMENTISEKCQKYKYGL